MNARAIVTWLLAATMACVACSREGGEDTSPAARIDLLRAYRANPLPPIRFGLLQGYHTTELFSVRSCAIPIAEGK